MGYPATRFPPTTFSLPGMYPAVTLYIYMFSDRRRVCDEVRWGVAPLPRCIDRRNFVWLRSPSVGWKRRRPDRKMVAMSKVSYRTIWHHHASFYLFIIFCSIFVLLQVPSRTLQMGWCEWDGGNGIAIYISWTIHLPPLHIGTITSPYESLSYACFFNFRLPNHDDTYVSNELLTKQIKIKIKKMKRKEKTMVLERRLTDWLIA